MGSSQICVSQEPLSELAVRLLISDETVREERLPSFSNERIFTVTNDQLTLSSVNYREEVRFWGPPVCLGCQSSAGF